MKTTIIRCLPLLFLLGACTQKSTNGADKVYMEMDNQPKSEFVIFHESKENKSALEEPMPAFGDSIPHMLMMDVSSDDTRGVIIQYHKTGQKDSIALPKEPKPGGKNTIR